MAENLAESNRFHRFAVPKIRNGNCINTYFSLIWAYPLCVSAMLLRVFGEIKGYALLLCLLLMCLQYAKDQHIRSRGEV